MHRRPSDTRKGINDVIAYEVASVWSEWSAKLNRGGGGSTSLTTTITIATAPAKSRVEVEGGEEEEEGRRGQGTELDDKTTTLSRKGM